MKLRASVLCALGIFGGSTVVAAAPISRVTAMLAGEVLPPGLGIAAVALPPAIVDRDVDPADVTVTWAQSPHVGRGTARIAIRDGRRTRRGWVTLTVAPMREVAIAAHGIPAGTMLGAADVRVERRAVAEGSSLDAVVGSLTQAPLEEGELIAATALVPPATIAAGTAVAIQAVGPGFTIRSRGTLASPARLGGPCVVRMPGRGQVHGRLVGLDSVVVQVSP